MNRKQFLKTALGLAAALWWAAPLQAAETIKVGILHSL